MDRLETLRLPFAIDRRLAGCGLALTLALGGAGCRTPKSEVPPSPAFSGNAQAPIDFGSSPQPMSAAAGMGMQGGSTLGTPGPSGAPNYGMAGAGSFGGPGTNMGGGAGAAAGAQPTMPPPSSMPGMGAPAGMDAPAGAGAGAMGMPPVGGAANPTTGIPQMGTGATGPAAGIGAAPTPGSY